MRTRRSAIQYTITGVTLTLLFLAAVAYASRGKGLKFEVTTMAEIVDIKAAEAGFHTAGDECIVAVTNFKVSNGESASIVSAYFATPSEANRFFDWNLEDVAEVKKREQNRYDGKNVGQRAVVLLKANAWRVNLWQVMWTHGSTFRRFVSSDLAVALELERLNRGRDSEKSRASSK